ncbi:hypothetical protein HK096_010726 [Nowakowskiella sp. JEL0078]|nr:hypothetical protein HK096_010726 [Nowakowskiella sp. JEL0078]
MLRAHGISKKDVSYEMSDIIGVGGFSSVYRGTWSGNQVAIKVVHPNVDVDISNEINILLGLRHPNIVQVYGANIEEKPHFVVLELISNGTLHHYLQRNIISKIEVRSFIRQVANGMSYLHGLNILHGDIKALNILVSDEKMLKISDFGLSRVKSESSSGKTTGHSVKGTLRWLAPERLQGGGLNQKVDVYAFSMLCYEIASNGKIPFEIEGVREEYQIYRLIEQKKRPVKIEDIEQDIWELIELCWGQDPKERPEFSFILYSLSDENISTNKTLTTVIREFSKANKSYDSPTERNNNAYITNHVPYSSQKHNSNNSYLSNSILPSSGSETLDNSRDITEESDNLYHSRIFPRKTESDNLYITENIELIPIESPLALVNPDEEKELLTETKESSKDKFPFYKNKWFIVGVVLFLMILITVIVSVSVVSTSANQGKGNNTEQTSPQKDSPQKMYLIRNYTGHTSQILSITLHPEDSSRLWSMSSNEIYEWSTKTGKLVRNFTSFVGDFTSMVVISGNPPRMWTAYSKNSQSGILEWDINTGQVIRQHINSVYEFILEIAVSQESLPRMWYSTTRNVKNRYIGNMVEYNVNTGTVIREYKEYINNNYGSIQIYPGSPLRLWTYTSNNVGVNNSLIEWNVDTGEAILTFTKIVDTPDTHACCSLIIFPANPSRAWLLGTFRIREWDLLNDRLVKEYDFNSTAVWLEGTRSIVPGNPPKFFAYGSLQQGDSYSTYEWDTNTGKLTKNYTEPFRNKCVAFSTEADARCWSLNGTVFYEALI